MAAIAGTVAYGQVTYTYTGNPFTHFDGGYTCTAGSGECAISGSFTLPARLPANLNEPVTGNGYTFTPSSFSFTDGVNVLNQANAPCGYACTGPEFEVFQTDANGIPTVWNIDVGTGGFFPRYQIQFDNVIVNSDCCIQDVSLHYDASGNLDRGVNGNYNEISGENGLGIPGAWSVSPTKAHARAYAKLSDSSFGIQDLTTGTFTQLGTSAGIVGLGELGGLLYGAGGTALYRVNPANGILTSVGNGTATIGVFGSTNSGLFGLDNSMSLYSIDPTTGASTLIGPTGISPDFHGGMSSGSNTLYYADEPNQFTGPSNLYWLDTTTGAATLIGSNSTTSAVFGPVLVNGNLYAASCGTGDPSCGFNPAPESIYTLNPTNGTATLVTASTATTIPDGMAPIIQRPSIVSLAPNSGTGLSQTFTAVYSDPNGLSDLSTVFVLFNTTVKLSNACVVVYVSKTNKMFLYNDTGTGFSTGVTPGSSAQVSNSQCTLAGTGSSVSTSGIDLTLNVALTFNASFAGQQTVFLHANGKTTKSGWPSEGTWTP